MKTLIILDFDGTLADTRELIVRTNQDAMRRMRYPVADEQSIVATIGLPLREGILALFPDLPHEDLPVWVRTYREVFESLKTKIVPALFPHVRETLAALCDRGCTLTVASSRGSESLNGFLRDMGIAPYIGYVLGADDVTRAKPDPEPVLKTLADLGVAATDALVVGDMPVDVQMGLGAGAWTCGVTYGNSGRDALTQAGAHYVIDDFAGLLPIAGDSRTSSIQ
ncbi:MAG: HAD family hydrolase [Bacteroidales bacterium]|nr:HAD family hydrolase [Bacteroidales bacterium]